MGWPGPGRGLVGFVAGEGSEVAMSGCQLPACQRSGGSDPSRRLPGVDHSGPGPGGKVTRLLLTF